jgi:hypothetical protein
VWLYELLNIVWIKCDWYVVSKYCKNKKSFGNRYLEGVRVGTTSQIEDALPASPIQQCRRLFERRRWRCSKLHQFLMIVLSASRPARSSPNLPAGGKRGTGRGDAPSNFELKRSFSVASGSHQTLTVYNFGLLIKHRSGSTMLCVDPNLPLHPPLFWTLCSSDAH